MATCGYDDDGVKTTRWHLIKDGMFVDYQTTRDQAHLIGQKASHGCSYADSWGSIPFQRMPNVSLEPGAKDRHRAGHHRRDRRRHLHQGRRELQHRPPALQLPVQRPDVLGGQERQDHDAAARSSPTSRTRRSSGSRATCSAASRPISWAARSATARGSPAQSNSVSHGCPVARFARVNILNTGTLRDHMIWTKEQAKALTDRASSRSARPRRRSSSLNGGDRANLRFARNTATTSGASSGYSLAITASFGKRSGTVTTARVRRRQPAARRCGTPRRSPRLSPENPEAMPFLGPQTYSPREGVLRRRGGCVGPSGARRQPTTAIDAEQEEGRRVGRVRRDAGADPGGRQLEGTVRLRPLHRGRLQPDGADAGRIGIGLGVEVVQRAAAARSREARRPPRSTRPRWSKNPAAIEPGKYTVVLEPAALADLLVFMLFSADARQADEGRSFFSKKGGGNRVGEQIVGEKVRIYSDPAHPLAPGVPFDNEGLPIGAEHVGRERRAEGPVLLALLGAEDEEGSRRRARRT